MIAQTNQQTTKTDYYALGKWDGKVMGEPDQSLLWHKDYAQGYIDGLMERPDPMSEEF